MNKFSDQEIIDLCLQGKTEAFRVLLDRYQRLVLAICYRSTGNWEDAGDLSQEVFLRVYKSLGNFKRDAAFKPWLYRITINRIITFLKNKSKKNESYEENLSEIASKDIPQDKEALLKQTVERLSSEIAKMPEHFRNVLILRFYMEMSYNEMAETLGISVNLAKAHLFRARKSLRENNREILLQLFDD